MLNVFSIFKRKTEIKVESEIEPEIEVKVEPEVANYYETVETKQGYPSIIDVPIDSFLDFSLRCGMGQYNSISAQQAINFYRKTAAVATAIDKIADEAEKIQPVIKLPDGKYEENHELLDRLKIPNDRETYKEFIGSIARYVLITGTSYVYAGGPISSPPLEIYSKRPQNVSYQLSSTNDYAASFDIDHGIGQGNYLYSDETTAGVRYYTRDSLRELYSIKRFSSTINNEVLGDSPLLSAALEVDQQIKGRYHNVKLLDNGARLSMVVTFNDNPEDKELVERKQALKEQLTGPENAGGITVVGQDGMRSEGAPMSIQELGTTNKDMDYSELDRVSREAIYMRYGVPLPLVSIDASTFNNMEQAIYQLYYWAVFPLIDKLFAGIGRMLMPRYNLDPSKFSLTYNPEDVEAIQGVRLENIKKIQELGVETINETRSRLPKREPLDGGDILYQPANLVPVGTDIFTEDNPTTTREAEQLARGRKPPPLPDASTNEKGMSHLNFLTK